MVLCSAQLGARTLTLKVFRAPLRHRKPAYVVVLGSDGNVRAYKHGHGEITEQSEVTRAFTIAFAHAHDSDLLRQALQLLRRHNLNVAYACVFLEHPGEPEWMTDWILSLPVKHRDEATRAHTLLAAELGSQNSVEQPAPLAEGGE